MTPLELKKKIIIIIIIPENGTFRRQSHWFVYKLKSTFFSFLFHPPIPQSVTLLGAQGANPETLGQAASLSR